MTHAEKVQGTYICRASFDVQEYLVNHYRGADESKLTEDQAWEMCNQSTDIISEGVTYRSYVYYVGDRIAEENHLHWIEGSDDVDELENLDDED